MGLHLVTIRHAAVAALLAEAALVPLVGARVFANRTRPLHESELPALRLYTDRERIENEGGPRILERTVELTVEVVVAEDTFTSKEADQLDEIAEHVERWFLRNEQLEDVWQAALLVRTESGLTAEGSRPVGVLRLTYEVEYEDLRAQLTPAEIAALPDLELIHVEYDLPEIGDTPDATDDVEMETA